MMSQSLKRHDPVASTRTSPIPTCVCVCVCVRERYRHRERDADTYPFPDKNLTQRRGTKSKPRTCVRV